jgi:hypothetical protein
MFDFKPFLSWTFPHELLQQRQRVIDDLVRYVLRGVESRYEVRQHPSASAFTDSVRSTILTSYERLMTMPKKYKAETGDTASFVINAFKHAQKQTQCDRLIVPPFSDKVLTQRFCAEFNVPEERSYEVPPTVAGAYHQANMNLTEVETQIVSLTALFELLKINDFRPPALAGSGEISEELWSRRRQFMLHFAMFGGLLGGATAAHTVRVLTTEMCFNPDPKGVQFSVIEFLQVGGRTPGQWPSKLCDQFRDDICDHYEARGTDTIPGIQ